MLSFKEYLNEERENLFLEEQATELFEALIKLGGQAYPKFGNFVIMAGGAGSGKGFVLDKLVGVEGKVFDVDALKKAMIKSDKIVSNAEKKGINLSRFRNKDTLRNPDNVSDLHAIAADDLKLPKRKEAAFVKSASSAAPDRKPNVIFDVTLKDFTKLEKLVALAGQMGYEKKNIHIVWVVNDIIVAMKQNRERDRVVHDHILMATHKGASLTMKQIIDSGSSLRKHMDGDIVFALNKTKVDNNYIGDSPNKGSKSGGYMKTADYIYIKRQGEAPMGSDQLSRDILSKIKEYVPTDARWK